MVVGISSRGEQEMVVIELSLLKVLVEWQEKVGETRSVEELVVGGEGFPDGGVKTSGGLGVTDMDDELLRDAVAEFELDVADSDGGDGCCTQEKEEAVGHVGARL